MPPVYRRHLRPIGLPVPSAPLIAISKGLMAEARATMDGIQHKQGGGEALRQDIAPHMRWLGAALLRM